jgi:hypothetical protein
MWVPLNGHEMKSQKLNRTKARMPKGVILSVFLSYSVLPAGATVTVFNSINAAVTARGDTLIEGIGFERDRTGNGSNQNPYRYSTIEFLGAPGGPTFYTLPSVGTDNFSSSSSQSFIFAYNPTQQRFEYTVSGTTYFDSATLAEVADMTGFYIELSRSSTSATAPSVSGLNLTTYDQLNSLGLGGTSFSLLSGQGSRTAYIDTALLSGGFYLTGNASVTRNETKGVFRLWTGSTPVPEASAFAFGAALLGGLILVESRRRVAKSSSL